MEATATALVRELIHRGLTQVEIARRTSIPQPRLSRWAAGKSSRAADDALKLQRLLQEVPPQEAKSG